LKGKSAGLTQFVIREYIDSAVETLQKAAILETNAVPPQLGNSKNCCDGCGSSCDCNSDNNVSDDDVEAFIDEDA
jgi:uncharacterized protein (DUF779 family)